ncbi:MAG TPA: nicotinamide-nucleotide amidohydrolase family protein [Syntrophorhabdaceae bacterium]|nr:nicotinamide-nucleotide amidohydrolase family protein [Syntrophorhabdaceae bacterium]
MKLEKKISAILVRRGMNISVAESCTGGLISKRITDIAGSSTYFLSGLVTYSNAAKTKYLSVPERTIARHGAVSEIVARDMAKGVRKSLDADIGLSVTGIAGPGGGSTEKPVGLVYMALSSQKKVFAAKFVFSGNRTQIRKQAADKALQMLLDYLEGRLA